MSLEKVVVCLFRHSIMTGESMDEFDAVCITGGMGINISPQQLQWQWRFIFGTETIPLD